MNLRAVSVGLLLFGTMLLPGYAADRKCKCVATGPVAGYLKDIGSQAATTQGEIDEIADYLNNAWPDWDVIADRMSDVSEDIQRLHGFVSHLESLEVSLPPDQAAQFEKLKAGVATLTIFANRVNTMLQDRRIWPHRNDYLAQVHGMEDRCTIIRKAAHNLRVSATA